MVAKKRKILLAIVLSVLVVIVIFLFSVTRVNNKRYRSNEINIGTAANSDKKALLIYQPSNSDFSKTVAEEIARGLSEDGYRITINYPGDYLAKNLEQYPLVILGSPTFMFSCSTVMRDYVKSITNMTKGKVVIYSVGMLNGQKELDEFESWLPNKKADVKFKIVNTGDDKYKEAAYTKGKEIGQ